MKSPLFGFGTTSIVVVSSGVAMPAQISTTMFCVAESLHPLTSVNEYTKGYVPAPTDEASKLFPLTPGPVYVPPAGEPPESGVGPSMSQNVSFARTTVTTGGAFTVTLTVDVFEQPFASVPVTVYVVDAVGASVTGEPESDPGIQLYDVAPFPVNVIVSPAQEEDTDEDEVTEGSAFTAMETVDVFEQPFPSVPVTVNVVLVFGETETEVPLSDPGIQLYVFAFAPVSVVASPSQIVDADADAVTDGSVFTTTETVVVFEQPFASVPVTVYVVFVFGATKTEVPLSDPGIQLYVFAFAPVSVVASPSQIVGADAEAATAGNVFTVTVIVAVFEHPGPFVPVTVYVVVADGETVTEEPVNDPGIHV